jgi:argininosuccinate lyase
MSSFSAVLPNSPASKSKRGNFMGGRLSSESKAPEVVEHLMTPFLKDQEEYFDVHLKIHKAHVVMLSTVGLLDSQDTDKLLTALLGLEHAGKAGLSLHLNTDLYMQMERFVIERTGDLGGRMHTGRSRNDLYATASRLMTRDKLLGVLDCLVDLQSAIIDKAGKEAGTVMPGYTHLQHAEPITLGHYLLGFFDVIDRDIRRVMSAYDEANVSALGAAALLGCGGVAENSYDAVASRDYLLQAGSALAILCGNIARVTDHIILWVTSEHNMFDLPDGYCYSSSIMPQKRNPNFFLESLRARSARVNGHLMGALGTVKGTIFAHSRDMSYEINVPVNEILNDATAMVRVMCGVLTALTPKREAMLSNCSGQFSGATELANLLVQECGLPFRSAYLVVATLVRQATARSQRPQDISCLDLDDVSTQLFGKKLGLPNDKLQAALDPARNVQMKQTAGSPGQESIEAMLRLRHTRLEQIQRTLEQKKRTIDDANQRLAAEIANRVSMTAA